MERNEEVQTEVGMPGPKGEVGEGESDVIPDLKCRKICHVKGGLGDKARRWKWACFVHC